MPIAIKTCPHCGTTWSENYSIGIGDPLHQCSSCQQYFLDPDVTEWELKPFLSKVAYWGVVAWTSVLISMVPVFICVWLVGESEAEAIFLPVWILSFLAAILWRGYANYKQIRTSRERTRDPVYRGKLIRAGLLRE